MDEKNMPNDLDIKPTLEINPGSIAYLTKYIFPFIHIADAGNSLSGENCEIDVERLSNGWVVQNYSNTLIIASYAAHLKAQTITAQLTIAHELAKRVNDFNWQNPSLVEGSPTMITLLYLELQRFELQLKNYEPNETEERLLHQLKETHPQTWNLVSPLKGAS